MRCGSGSASTKGVSGGLGDDLMVPCHLLADGPIGQAPPSGPALVIGVEDRR
jgi:hypothetical protein